MTSSPTIEVVVRQRQLQGGAVAVLALARPDGTALPPFTAGAHVDLHLPQGLVRPYSLCGNPREHGQYRLGVLLAGDSRGGSAQVHRALVEGTRFGISAPRNHFPLQLEAPHSVLLGAGIGITPLIAMAWALHEADRSFELHYCIRDRQRAAFLDELGAVPWASCVRVHESGTAARRRLDPRDVLRAAPAGHHVYACGPEGFMDAVQHAALDGGLPRDRVHRESFGAADVAPQAGDTAFEVMAARTGRQVLVGAGERLHEALRRIGVVVPVSCEQGVCGTCACTVLEGTPDHRDQYLDDDERAANDQLLACCSRARSPRLILDL